MTLKPDPMSAGLPPPEIVPCPSAAGVVDSSYELGDRGTPSHRRTGRPRVLRAAYGHRERYAVTRPLAVRSGLTAMRNRLPPASSVFLVLSLLGIVMGAVLRWGADEPDAANLVWGLTTAIGLVPIGWEVSSGIVKRQVGVDLIAILAMAGALALGEYLAGAVIAFMLATGRALEDFADVRAHRELSALLERAPRSAHRYGDGSLSSVPVGDVRAGDLLLVKPGEVVPVDGLLVSAIGVLGESALTGESRPVERGEGEQIRSGAVNAGAAFDLRAVASADQSTYAGIVRLVEQAQREKAPFVRLADRYALIFVPVTLVVAVLAWAITGDAVRALAVLVVATPCPLILAAPIAIVAGISRAAKRGIIVKGGGALEALGRGRVLLFDKTGTLTAGTPEVAEVFAFGELDPDEVLRLGASLDQLSPSCSCSCCCSSPAGAPSRCAPP